MGRNLFQGAYMERRYGMEEGEVEEDAKMEMETETRPDVSKR